MIYFLLSFNLMLVEHRCLQIKTDPRIPSENIDSILKQYVKPIRRLTEQFPNHHVEVQLDIAVTNAGGVRYDPRLPYRRAMDLITIPSNMSGFQSSSLIPPPVVPYILPQTKKPKSKKKHRQPRQPRQHNSNSKPNIKQVVFENKPEHEHQKVINVAVQKDPNISIGKLTTLVVPIARAEEEPSVHANRPIYLQDLTKMMTEFEKKLNPLVATDNLDPAVEEGKQPLLKKDLWLALGLKYASGCSNQNHVHLPNVDPNRHNEMLAEAAIDKAVNTNQPTLNRLMDLLRQGVKVQKYPPNPGQDNLHWLQIKIPKN